MGSRTWGRRPAIAAIMGASAFAALSSAADAGGFAVREQSTEFQGMSFAGHGAAGGGLSGMFWNPAVAAYAPAGIYTESHYAAIAGRVEVTGDVFNAGTGANLGLPRESGDIAKDAIVPSSYLSYRINERLVAAISVNSPFGLVTEPANRNWAGQTFARTSEIKTYNFAPTLAYKLSDSIAVAVGVQIQHIEGRLKSASGTSAAHPNSLIQGDDTAFGFTAGVNFRPNDHTNIGLGYRSSIDHTLEGSLSVPGAPASLFGGAAGPLNQGVAVKAGITLPEIVTLSLRQELTEKLTVLGSVEWSHWGRAEKLDVVCVNNGAGGNAALCPAGNGQLARSLALGWHDGWFFALGGEYEYSEKLTLRSGIAYEISPIQAPDERSLRVPDTDRFWASLGATYKWNDKMAFDFAYTHIFGIGDDKIDRIERTGTTDLRFIGSVDAQVDIVSASLKIKLGDSAEKKESLK